MVHNNANAAGSAYAKLTDFDVEDLAVDLAYWFKGSMKRKAGLEEFCQFCDSTYMEVVNHVQTRWLSLDKAVNRMLRLFTSLKSYFQSNNESQARFRRLSKYFEDPMTEVHLFFFQAALPAFMDFNMLLQRQDATIHLLHKQMNHYIKKLFSKFMKPEKVKDLKVTDIQYSEGENQLPDDKLSIGSTTKTTLNRLIEAGDITTSQADRFFVAVRGFYGEAVKYAISRLPIDEPIIKHAAFVDWGQRMQASVFDVLYFSKRYKDLLPYLDPREEDKLGEEFSEYQLLEDTEIPASIWKGVMSHDTEAEAHYVKGDKLWAYLSSLENVVTGKPRFPRLAEVARLVLCLPHSNADAERVFSAVGLNKTSTRNSLKSGWHTEFNHDH